MKNAKDIFAGRDVSKPQLGASGDVISYGAPVSREKNVEKENNPCNSLLLRPQEVGNVFQQREAKEKRGTKVHLLSGAHPEEKGGTENRLFVLREQRTKALLGEWVEFRLDFGKEGWGGGKGHGTRGTGFWPRKNLKSHL